MTSFLTSSAACYIEAVRHFPFEDRQVSGC